MGVEMQATEHPYIVTWVAFRNEPIIRDTRVSVRLIAHYYRAEMAIEEIERTHPELSPAMIHDAISYYLDHREEMDSSPLVAELDGMQATLERNRAEGTMVSGAALRERMVGRGVLVG